MTLDPQPQHPRDQDPVLGVLIPDHSHDPIVVVGLDRLDGGWHAVCEHLEGEPEEYAYPGRRDVVAFVREDAARSDLPLNLRATRILRDALPAGRLVQGPCLIVGQEASDGLGRIVELPEDVTAEALMAAGSVRADDEREPAKPSAWIGDLPPYAAKQRLDQRLGRADA